MDYRRPFTAVDAGVTESALRWKLKTGAWQRVMQGVYLEGDAPPSLLETAMASLHVTNGIASHTLAATLHALDGVRLKPPWITSETHKRAARVWVSHRRMPATFVVVVDGLWCTNGLQTMIDLASQLSDTEWEQALESALRKRLVMVGDVRDALDGLGASRVEGVGRMRRVLDQRRDNLPATESLLETLMVQLIRSHTSLPVPSRQVEVQNRYGSFVARVDLAWPSAGVFIELDGQHHLDQPVHDACRETAVVAATGWLPGRFTWHEVTRTPRATARRLEEIFAAATWRHRP